MSDETLNQAIALIKSGQNESARAILTQLIQVEPGNAAAWLWLAETMPDDDRRIVVLEDCLKLNPQNEMVQRGLERLHARQALTVKTPRPKIDRVPVYSEPDEAHISTALDAHPFERTELLAEKPSKVRQRPGGKRKPTAGHRRQSCSRWLILVILGLFAAAAVGSTVYFMRDQLRAWLGLIGVAVSSTPQVNTQLTPFGDDLTSQATLTPIVPTSTLTPTPTITPVPTPTTTVAFTFTYNGISPENANQVVQVGELPSIPARSVAISSDNRMLAAGMDDATLSVWNLTAGDILYTLQGHTKPVNAVAFSPDNRLLVSASDDGTVRIWDLSVGKEVRTLIGGASAVKSVAFSPDGQTFVSGSMDGSLKLWQLGVNTAGSTMPAGGPINSLDFSPDGRLLAIGLQTGAIKVLDVATGSILKTLLGHNGGVNSVEFAPSGHRLATGSADKSVKLWDVDSGKVLYTVGTHTDSVLSVSFSPDGRVLASASLGQTIKLWDVAQRREISLLRHARNMPAITFSPDGRVLAAALSPVDPRSQEGGVALWGIMSNPEATPAPEALTLTALQEGKWLPSARMAVPHVAHQAVSITGGRVMIIGGGDANDPLSFTNKVELYNPANGTSLFTGALNVSRGLFSATLLKDGRVLVVGGFNATMQWLASAEIYDPTSGAWSLNQPLFNHGVGHTAVLLLDGRVLVAGGCVGDGPDGRINRAELFDPATNSWAETAPMSASRCGHSAVLLADDRVLAAGGDDGDGYLSSAEVFDPVTLNWSTTGALNTARSEAVAVLLMDGRVMVAGGLAAVRGNMVTLNTVEIYDANLGKWEQVAPMSHTRYGHTANLIPGGMVLVVGGVEDTEGQASIFLDSVDVFNPADSAWIPIASLDIPRAYHTTTLLPDGRFFVAGGMRAKGLNLADTLILAAGRPPAEPTSTLVVEETLETTITPDIQVTSTLTSTMGIEATSTP